MNLYRLAVGLGAVGTSAQVPDPKGAAGNCMDERAIGGAVICEQLLDRHPVAGKERDGSPEEGHDGGGFLVSQDLGEG